MPGAEFARCGGFAILLGGAALYIIGHPSGCLVGPSYYSAHDTAIGGWLSVWAFIADFL
jgi:hypothetical protein